MLAWFTARTVHWSTAPSLRRAPSIAQRGFCRDDGRALTRDVKLRGALFSYQCDVGLLLSTEVCACFASSGACLAVIHRMTATLGRAFIAKGSAGLKKFICAFAASSHHGKHKSAGVRAVKVPQDASGQRHWFFLLDAGTRAVLACRHAVVQPSHQSLVI